MLKPISLHHFLCNQFAVPIDNHKAKLPHQKMYPFTTLLQCFHNFAIRLFCSHVEDKRLNFLLHLLIFFSHIKSQLILKLVSARQRETIGAFFDLHLVDIPLVFLDYFLIRWVE